MMKAKKGAEEGASVCSLSRGFVAGAPRGFWSLPDLSLVRWKSQNAPQIANFPGGGNGGCCTKVRQNGMFCYETLLLTVIES